MKLYNGNFYNRKLHQHLKACTCSGEACICAPGSLHMLNWSVHMLMCGCEACSTGSVHMPNWKCARAQFAHAQLKRARADVWVWSILYWKCAYVQLKMCTCSIDVCACSTEGLHMHNCSVQMLFYRCEVCICSTGSVRMCMFICECAYAQQRACTCSTICI